MQGWSYPTNESELAKGVNEANQQSQRSVPKYKPKLYGWCVAMMRKML